jgi:hypothetical protein
MIFVRDADLDARRDELHRMTPWSPKVLMVDELRGPGRLGTIPYARRMCLHCDFLQEARMLHRPDLDGVVAPEQEPGSWALVKQSKCDVLGQRKRASLHREHMRRLRRARRKAR